MSDVEKPQREEPGTAWEPGGAVSAALVWVLERERRRRERLVFWFRIGVLAVFLGGLGTTAGVVAAFDTGELERSVRFAASDLAEGMSYEIPGAVETISAAFLDAGADRIARTWPRVLEKADSNYLKLRKDLDRSVAKEIRRGSRDRAKAIEAVLAERYPDLVEENPRGARTAALKIGKALDRALHDAVMDRLEAGRDAVERGYGVALEMGVDGAGETRGETIRERMLSHLDGFLERYGDGFEAAGSFDGGDGGPEEDEGEEGAGEVEQDDGEKEGEGDAE